MFHRWYATDDERTDACIGCGVVSHVETDPDGVTVDHGPLPIICPGPQDAPAHHFILIGPVGGAAAFLDCQRGCGVTVTDTTDPAAVVWACIEN